MSRDQARYLLVVGLLVVAVGIAFVLMQGDRLVARGRGGGFEFVTDVDHWQRTDRERVVTTPYNFASSADLAEIPLQLGEWKGLDVPQTNLEVFILLEPEQYVQRMYTLPDGRFLYLSLIGSRKSKSFHSPQICYSTDGWRTDSGSEAITLARGELYALKLVADKQLADGARYQHIVQYFYLWPTFERDPNGGIVLVKVTAPLTGSVEESLALEDEFLRLLFRSAGS